MKLAALAFLLYCVVCLVRSPATAWGAKVLLFLDMFVCAIIWRDSGITISSMTGLAFARPAPPLWAVWLHAVLNGISKDHCELAFENDAARSRAALEILTGKVLNV